MYCKYGSFNFHPYECSLGVSANFKRSERGFKLFQEVVFRFVGEVIEADQYATNSRFMAIANAFSNDKQSCGLMHDNGTPTWHWMKNTAEDSYNYTDVQVVDMRLPETRGGEFISGRNFELTVASLYRHTDESTLLEFHETIRRTGNAGPKYQWEYNKFWGYYPVLVSPTTLQTIVQEGYAVKMNAYPMPQLPVYSPPFEQNHERVINFIGPKRLRKGHYHYTTQWRYTYLLPVFDDTLVPHLSPIMP
jgi:hypothetical protein